MYATMNASALAFERCSCCDESFPARILLIGGTGPICTTCDIDRRHEGVVKSRLHWTIAQGPLVAITGTAIALTLPVFGVAATLLMIGFGLGALVAGFRGILFGISILGTDSEVLASALAKGAVFSSAIGSGLWGASLASLGALGTALWMW